MRCLISNMGPVEPIADQHLISTIPPLSLCTRLHAILIIIRMSVTTHEPFRSAKCPTTGVYDPNDSTPNCPQYCCTGGYMFFDVHTPVLCHTQRSLLRMDLIPYSGLERMCPCLHSWPVFVSLEFSLQLDDQI